MTKDEALDKALEFVEANHLGGQDAFELIAAIKQARSDHTEDNLEMVAAPVQELDAAFFRQVLSVAIAGLYAHYKDDVLRVFTLDDLQKVVDLAEPLQLQQVEDIYKRAWEMLTTPPAAQRQWVGLTDEDLANCSGHEVRWALYWEKLLKEKNT